MENQERKTTALLLVLSTFYLALFDWDLSSFSNFKFSSAYTVGIVGGLIFVMTERFVKHSDNPNFQWKTLLKTNLFAFLIFCPLSIILILPHLNRKNIWRSDYAFAFLLTYFLITVGPKIPTMYEKLDRLLEPKNGNKKEK